MPPSGSMPRPFPKGSGAQKSPSGIQAGFLGAKGPGIGAQHVHDLSGMEVRSGSRLELDADQIHIEGIGNLKEEFLNLKAKVDLLVMAIEMAHQKDAEGNCVEACWSCRIAENIESIRVARKIGGESSD